MALAFARPDVDVFLGEVTHEQYMEWAAFLSLEPDGWQAMRHTIRRLSYSIFQSQSSKPLKEADYDIDIRLSGGGSDVEHARLEAAGIRAALMQD